MSDAASIRSLYSLHETRRVRLRVNYPIGLEQLVLRTQMDWDKDVLPRVTDNAGSFAEFELETTLPFLYLKPCLRTPTGLQWAIGPNRLVVATRDDVHNLYPAFCSADEGKILDLITFESRILNRQHSLRVYLPAGYDGKHLPHLAGHVYAGWKQPVLPAGSLHGTGLGGQSQDDFAE